MRRWLVVVLAGGIAGCGGDETTTDTSSGASTGGGQSSDSSGASSSATMEPSTSTTAATSTSSTSTGDSGVTSSGEVCDGLCVAMPPVGWQGPFEVHTTAGPPPACDPGYQMEEERLAGFTAPAGTCGCDCGKPQGLSCGDEILHINQGLCNKKTAVNFALTPGECAANPPIPVGASFTSTQSQPQGGTCSAQIVPALDPPEFSTSVRACAPVEPLAPTGCDPGWTCAPPIADGARICIALDGDVPCPAGFSDRVLTFTGATDTRTCPDVSACDCTLSASCTGSFETFIKTDCSSAGFLYDGLGWDVCVDLHGPFPDVPPGSIRLTATPGGTCDSSGDVPPDGDVAPEQPRTYCCKA